MNYIIKYFFIAILFVVPQFVFGAAFYDNIIINSSNALMGSGTSNLDTLLLPVSGTVEYMVILGYREDTFYDDSDITFQLRVDNVLKNCFSDTQTLQEHGFPNGDSLGGIATAPAAPVIIGPFTGSECTNTFTNGSGGYDIVESPPAGSFRLVGSATTSARSRIAMFGEYPEEYADFQATQIISVLPIDNSTVATGTPITISANVFISSADFSSDMIIRQRIQLINSPILGNIWGGTGDLVAQDSYNLTFEYPVTSFGEFTFSKNENRYLRSKVKGYY